MFSLKTWTTAGLGALLALGAVGCGAYEPEPEVPQYQYAEPAPRPMTAEELAAYQAAHPEEQQGEEVAIGEDDAQADEYQDTDPSALTEFKPALEGHGEWVDDSTYGTVWKPNATEVGADFEPYVTAGHWTYADDTDYVWVSDYSWGWAPYHYGRWVVLPAHGWVWIPGRRYAGAWVTWRTAPGYGYVGWAPAPPDYYWYNGYAVGWSFGFYHHYDHYYYCHHDHFFYGGGVRSYVVTGPAARVHYERTVEYQPPPPQRVAASPTVNGQGRVAARPTVARPGPRPDSLGMGKDTIVAPPSNHGGLDRARTMAVPSTAVASGARAPIRPASVNGGNRAPASAASIPSHGGQPSFRASPSVGGSSASASRPSFAGGGPSNPSGRVSAAPRPSAPSQPIVRPSAPSAQPSFRPSTPSPSGGQAVRPSFAPSRPSAPSAAVRPSFTPSSPSVSRPSAPSRAATPSFRPSSPSTHSSSVRPASPSVSRPSGGGSRSSGSSVRRR
ncbi:MAG: DUF6600 domain-containing protein [Labilithrix sp.]